MEPLSDLTVTELADGICLRAGRIAAAQAELLRWVAEFDRREGWAGVGMLSCAHWLSWRTGLSPGAAREQVRVAHRLEELPAVAAAFDGGRVSYSKVRAITRAAEPDDGIDWVALARHSSAAQLEKIVRGIGRARFAELADTDPEAATWQLRTRWRFDDHGNFSVTISGPAEHAPLVRAGLDAQRAELQRDRDAAHAASLDEAGAAGCGEPDAAETPPAPAVTEAEALVALAEAALVAEQQAHPGAARRRRPQLTAQIDPLSGWARQADGELLPPLSLRQVFKGLPGRGGVLRLRPVTADDLRRHDLGRTRRDVSDPLRALLGTLDGERCRFPGCTRHRALHAHHVRPWSEGGATDLDNLLLLCSRHHTLVHTQGFALLLHPDRRLQVRTADGLAVLHHPAQPWADPGALATGCGQHVSAETLPPDHCDPRLDLRYAVSVLLAQAS